jgi:hypothetical protein
LVAIFPDGLCELVAQRTGRAGLVQIQGLRGWPCLISPGATDESWNGCLA